MPRGLDWDRDAAQLELVVKILAAQQTGIKFLAQVVGEDSARVDTVLEAETESKQ